ncbi:WhiB family transcriptional regulator [Streptomyces gardneri]|uniref:WhiB family transcriptional regulator n=1 Tax=Streptomyces gardneri TaxID=66892 RepID=UPI0035DD4A16
MNITKENALSHDAQTDPSPLAWRFAAACRGLELELFFSSRPGGAARKDTRLAKGVCAGCPVRQQCLEWALATDTEFGVFGGLDQYERQELLGRPEAAA